MKAIVVTDQAAGTAGMKLAERPEPPAAINDVRRYAYGGPPPQSPCAAAPKRGLKPDFCATRNSIEEPNHVKE
jgi:hypothetical protein